jgi:PAS domain S-box-containing protein
LEKGVIMQRNVICSKKVACTIAVMYILSSVIYISITDWLLSKFSILDVLWISTGKGVLFVLATGFLLYKLIQQNIKAIEEREEQLISLIENNTDAIMNLDLNGNILSVNEATERITGYSKEELTAMSFTDLVDKEDLDRFLQHFMELVKGNPSVIEVRSVQKKGNCIILDVKIVPTIIKHKLVGAFAIARDITKLKENEELIRKSEKLSIVGELASAVAHEVRNPLTSLKGFLQLFQYKAKKDEDKQYYSIMLSEIERINSIVSEFMILSKPQAITYQNRNIASLLTDVITLLEAISIMKNIEVTKEFEPNIPFIKCEGNQIKQVFINVFKNAIEAVPNNGKIDVQVKRLEDDKVLIRVMDNGRGIPHDLMPKLGEPFYTTKEKGTGLGLMVSYKIIAEHRGSIAIQSEMDKGTTVDIILPVSMGE